MKDNFHPELTRKLVHIVSGMISLTFPWLFTDFLPVLTICSISFLFVLISRYMLCLKNSFGRLVCSVNRPSYGDLYFPAGIALLFYISKGDIVLYSIPILILTFSDSLAALTGIKYGRIKFETADGEKSIEGSIVFFVTSFLSVSLPLLINNILLYKSLLIALLLSFLLTFTEALAWKGLDNLFIPVFGYYILNSSIKLAETAIFLRTAIAGALFSIVWLWRKKTTLNDSALLGVVILIYFCWGVSGWQWITAPLIIFLSYVFLAPRTELDNLRLHNIYVVINIALPGLCYLLGSKIGTAPELLFPYTISFSAQLAMIALARIKRAFPHFSATTVIVIATTKAFALQFIPFVFLQGIYFFQWKFLLLGLMAVFMAATIFYFLQPDLEKYPNDTNRWRRQLFIGSAVSLISWIFNGI